MMVHFEMRNQCVVLSHSRGDKRLGVYTAPIVGLLKHLPMNVL